MAIVDIRPPPPRPIPLLCCGAGCGACCYGAGLGAYAVERDGLLLLPKKPPPPLLDPDDDLPLDLPPPIRK